MSSFTSGKQIKGPIYLQFSNPKGFVSMLLNHILQVESFAHLKALRNLLWSYTQNSSIASNQHQLKNIKLKL